jgi:hypothetical protein
MRVLLRVTWLYELDVSSSIFDPVELHLTNVFGTILAADHRGLSAPPDQLVQRSDDTFGGQPEVDLDGQRPAVEISQYVDQPKHSAAIERVVHEVHQPHFVDPARHGQRSSLVAH